ncbi:target of EGR1 protein 1 [Diretmus argenteus]
MTSSMVVAVIDVQNDNFNELWPAMVLAIKTSSFIAVDTELSGLGNRTSLLAECIEERYKSICHAARSRSIISLGFACFKKLDNKAADSYLVQVYNLTLLCSEEYIIEPKSVQFLVQHGFDFNKQYAMGVPYCKGNNKGGLDYQGISMRALYTELLRAKKPLVLHNGLIDMAFLYQCFYAQLPERLAVFTADLSEIFPAGVYDTKYATEFELRLTASYLEYAYKKCKLDNSRSVASGGPGPHVHIEFCEYAGQMSSYVDYIVCPSITFLEGEPDSVCERFSAFGWCPSGSECPLSHDTDLIILQDERSKTAKRIRRKRQRDKKRGRGEQMQGSSVFEGAPENKVSRMELDPDQPPEHHQGETAEPCPESKPPPGVQQADHPPPAAGVLPVTTAATGGDDAAVLPMDSGRNRQRNVKVEGVKTESEGNGMCEGNTTADNDAAKITQTNANDGGGGGNATDNSVEVEAKMNKPEVGTHRAGFDAFMTGYIFAYACTLTKKEEEGEGAEDKKPQEEETWLPSCLNKLYLGGKAAPLNIVKSTFTKSSKAHLQKMEMVWGKTVASTLADKAQQGNV